MHLLPNLASLSLQVSSPALASVLIASVWQGLLLTAAVALALRCAPGLSAAARSAIWTAALPLLVLLALLPLGLHHTGGPRGGLVHLEETVSVALVLLWATASLFRLFQLCGDAFRLHGMMRRSIPVPVAGSLAALLASGRRRVRLCTSAEVDRPGVAGFLHPRILLPPSLLGDALSEAELAQIVLHELEHLRRYDDWINLGGQLSLVLLPLNPALLWLNRRLAVERELACDDGVLATTQARRAYAACLARVAEHALVRRSVSLALGVIGDWRRRSDLARRVERILSAPRPVMGLAQARLAGGLLCAGLLGGAGLLAHCPELVSFGPAASTFAAPETSTMMDLPVSATFTHSAAAHPMLLKAILPTSTTARYAHPSRRPHTGAPPLHRTHLRLVRRRAAAPPAPRWMTMTAWHSVTYRHPVAHAAPATLRLDPVFFGASQTWYTAVPWGGGWLVVQL